MNRLDQNAIDVIMSQKASSVAFSIKKKNRSKLDEKSLGVSVATTKKSETHKGAKQRQQQVQFTAKTKTSEEQQLEK